MNKLFPIVLALLFFGCTEEVVHGCLDSEASNYNSDANIDNNSCFYYPYDSWTDAQKREYKEACNQLNNTTEKQCNCAFEVFSNEYSYEQYSPSDENLSGYESSEEEIEKAIEMKKKIKKCFK